MEKTIKLIDVNLSPDEQEEYLIIQFEKDGEPVGRTLSKKLFIELLWNYFNEFKELS